ncbi:uncharacterized protein DNG_01959 [Cephalotrichum gorgonifer]|uniref:Rhomboid family membrane protein n=1 Tax=Cephalotrichum gorgonifer TaxID=2041049 RepID=A0AAE8SSA0_9PEZI|nr:uncharacterized protein DNG_01959 [Cephalotrichum gorgonifer]
MATETAPAPTGQENPPLITYAWMAVAVMAPIAMLMPPRRMDARFLILSGGFSLATDQLLKQYTGQGIYGRFTSRVNSVGSAFTPTLSERALETQRRLREEKARMEAGLSEEERRLLEQQRKKPTGLRGLFTADEGEDWKEKRLEAHRKGLEEGKGISDLIMEHVSDAFSKGDGKDGKEADEANKEKEKK